MKALGRKEFLKHKVGKRLARGEAILGKCYDCMGFYADGKIDCEMPECPLYGFMPYRVVLGKRFCGAGKPSASPYTDTTGKRDTMVRVRGQSGLKRPTIARLHEDSNNWSPIKNKEVITAYENPTISTEIG